MDDFERCELCFHCWKDDIVTLVSVDIRNILCQLLTFSSFRNMSICAVHYEKTTRITFMLWINLSTLMM